MRRRKDDKRVLRSGNGRQNNSRIKGIRKGNRQFFSSNKNNRRPFSPKRNNGRSFAPNRNNPRRHNKPKTNKKLVFFMIFALVAFVIGAGIGVSLSFDNGSDDGPKYENVTKEMTKNLNDTNVSYYYDELDDVDYNENVTSQMNSNYESYEDYQSAYYNQSYGGQESLQEDYSQESQ